jgi:hypothetical protein
MAGGSYGFQDPVAIAAGAADIWVANGSGTVTELNASTSSLVRVVSGSSYQLSDPQSIALDGAHVWVLDQGVGLRR